MTLRRRGEKVKKHRMRSFSQWLRSVEAKCTLMVLCATLAVFGLFCAVNAPKRYDMTVGSISHSTVTATKDVVDEITTENRREAAAAAVEPTYHLQEGASEQVISDLKSILDELHTVQQYGLTLRSEGETSAAMRNRVFTDTELEYAQGLITTVTLTDYQLSTLLRTDTQDFDDMVSTLEAVVENTLNTTIREGQVNQSINTILAIVGYRVETGLFQNVVPVVLRKCVQPNMVVDQDATELARQAARDAVEPVTYLQGQNIIVEGERVTANQIEMLRALGLLENNDFDLSAYGGGAILVLFAMAALLLLVLLFTPETLHDLRRMGVLMTALVLCVMICAVVMMTIDVYFVPITLASMLLTGLLGAPTGVAAALPVALIVSGMTAGRGAAVYSGEMVHLLVVGTVSSILSVLFIKGRPQRVRTLLCGLLVAAANLLLMVALGWMTSLDLKDVLTGAVWSMGSGVLCGVLAVGLQPVFETVFNLATPSKLLELSNPNQPLLRRLLIEAPGTYHHSIIVANLAEAAAEKINANPLLARTGAYFHDVGKLKRPLYFKENQMGENPHDHTDPYVSAAIVTSHTRDGLQLAQKYRLPKEIKQIIMEHHGDTPVMFFYHKALQQSNGKPVDIADFRYDGTRPSTKESAIVMLADTVEAAVRSMPDPTPEAIVSFIERLIRGKLEDGQLSNSPLTLKDIDGICEAFSKVLNGVFHERIEYPTTPVPTRDPFLINSQEKEEKAQHAEQTEARETERAEEVAEVAKEDAAESAKKAEEAAAPAEQPEKAVKAETEQAAQETASDAKAEKAAYEEPMGERVDVDFSEQVPTLPEGTEEQE